MNLTEVVDELFRAQREMNEFILDNPGALDARRLAEDLRNVEQKALVSEYFRIDKRIEALQNDLSALI